MGWRDNGQQAGTVTRPCDIPGDHYLTQVNKGSIRMQSFAGLLNEQHAKGYRLAHAFEQDGNTVMVFEHNHP